jgi:predicted TIM-barrel fold metal-dependent hydrolase
MPVIDAHTHVFAPEVVSHRTEIASKDASFGLLYGEQGARMVDGGGLVAYLEAEGIDLAFATSFPFSDHGLVRLSNDYVMGLHAQDPRIVPLIALPMTDNREALKELERCDGRGAVGVGEVAFYGIGFGPGERECLQPIAQALTERRFVLMLHVNEPVGHTYHGKVPIDFGELALFIASHPDLTIILSHMGGGICFYEFMPEIRERFSRVYYDLAAMPYLYTPDIYRFVAEFIPHKTLFGSDYPLLPLSRYERDMTDLDDAVMERILYGNAQRILRDARLG